MTTRPDLDTHGFVLSSGGADGAYAVGVIKALANGEAPFSAGKPADPCVVAGTSIGAFIAACFLSYEGEIASAAVDLERVWLDEIAGDNMGLSNGAFRFRGNPMDYLSPRRFMRSPFEGFGMFLKDGAVLAKDWSKRGARFVSSSDALPQRLMKLFSLSSFVSTGPLREVISRNVSFRRLRESKKTIAINATNATNGKLRTFYNQDLTDDHGLQILLASAAIPGFLPAVRLADDTYIDGAVLAYTKLSPAINAGARTLHLIHVDPDVADVAIADPEATVDTLFRMFGVTWAGRVGRGMRDSARINQQVRFLKEFVRDKNLSSEAAQELYRGMLPKGSFEREDSGERNGDPIRIAVHRYFPMDGGSDVLSMLNLGRRRIEALIQKGYDETLAHDCKRNNCILPSD